MRVASVPRQVALLLKEVFEPDGVNVRLNSGAAAGQDVFHCHAHYQFRVCVSFSWSASLKP